MEQKIIHTLDKKQTIRKLAEAEQLAGENVMYKCMGVRNGESVLIVTDTNLRNIEAAIFFESAKKFTDKVTLVEMQSSTEHAQEPPKKVAQMMQKFNVGLLVTTFSLTHTQARKEACKAGARIASMPGITHDIILRTLTGSYRSIAKLSKKIAKILTDGKKAVVKNAAGTNIELNLSGRTAIADTGIFTRMGDFGNLPAGEAFIAPVEGKGEGVIVFDGCFADIVLDKPLITEVYKGMVVKITGGKAAEILKKKLAKVGSKLAYNLAELGIGTNKNVRFSGNLLEIEKVYGTVHFALGNNATFGGEIKVPFHSDGVVLKPTLLIDKRMILDKGQFVI